MGRRSGLGKGLEALIPTSGGTAAAGAELREIPVEAIRPNPRQPRTLFDDDKLAELADSITELGVLQPLLVRQVGEEFELIAGERRWRASKLAGLTSVPAVVRVLDDETSLEQALVENLQRDDLSALEEAAAYQELIATFRLTQDQVALRVGKSRSAVANALRLLQLPDPIQAKLAEGSLSAGHCRALLGLGDREAMENLAARVVDHEWSVREVEAEVRRLTERTSATGTPEEARPPGDVRSAAVLELEQVLSDLLATRVQVKVGRGRGRMTVEFADLDDLERIYRVMTEGGVHPS